MRVTNTVPLETEEQKTLVHYLKIKKLFYFAVPNGSVLKGNKLQRAMQMAKLKSEGLVPGVSDIVVLMPTVIVFIEMKRTKGSAISKDQVEFLKRVNEYPFAVGRVCKGAKSAIDFIEEYLK